MNSVLDALTPILIPADSQITIETLLYYLS